MSNIEYIKKLKAIERRFRYWRILGFSSGEAWRLAEMADITNEVQE